jgi:hypothetical protein
MLREEQAAAHQQAWQCDAQGQHAQARFKAETVPGSRFAVAAKAGSMNEYASIPRRPF